MTDLGQRALAWVRGQLGFFFVAPASGPAEIRRVKQLGELATLGVALAEVADTRELVARAWDALDQGAHIAALLDRQPVIASVYLPFVRADLRSTALEARLLDRGWLAEHPRWPAFGRYAIGCVIEALAVEPPWHQPALLAALDLFSSPTGTTRLLDATLVAHVVMWRTSMGQDIDGLGPATTRRWRHAAPGWYDVLRRGGLLDPLAEIAIASVCVGDAVPAGVLDALARAQQPDGAVPPRHGATGASFADLYHSTLVAAIAGGRAGAPTRQADQISPWAHLAE